MNRLNLGINIGNDFSSSGGVYNATQMNSDLDYLSLFTNKLRVAVPTFSDASAVARMRLAAQACIAKKFNTMYGVGAGGTRLNQANFSVFAAAVVAEAVWANANGVQKFTVGNEEESSAQVSPSSLTSSGTTATFVSATAHGFADQQSLTIASASDSKYNGTFTITVVDPVTFTFTIPAGAASPATGAKAYDISPSQMATKIKTLATSVKAVFKGEVTYNASQGDSADYISGGKGDLDTFGMNNYGANGSTADFNNNITLLTNAFGTSGYLSEFNLNATWANVKGDDEQQAVAMKQRLNTILASNLGGAYFFTWRYSDDSFAAKYADGNLRTVFTALFQKRRTYYGNPNRNVI